MTLEEAIEKGYDAWYADWWEAPTLSPWPILADAVREWAKENADVPELAGYLARGNRIKAECSCGECEPVWTGDLRSAVPLDKFGGDK